MFSINPSALLNQTGLYISIVLSDQGMTDHYPQHTNLTSVPFRAMLLPPTTSPSLCPLKSVFILTCPTGPILNNGKPALSNPTACATANTFLSAFSFDSGSYAKDASFASSCKGVILAADVGAAPSVCACKFLVPHFSSFGVRLQASHIFNFALFVADDFRNAL